MAVLVCLWQFCQRCIIVVLSGGLGEEINAVLSIIKKFVNIEILAAGSQIHWFYIWERQYCIRYSIVGLSAKSLQRKSKRKRIIGLCSWIPFEIILQFGQHGCHCSRSEQCQTYFGRELCPSRWSAEDFIYTASVHQLYRYWQNDSQFKYQNRQL